MNAYPAELIHHHYACMLVSGLLPSQSQISSPEIAKSNGPPSTGTKDQPSTSTTTASSTSSSSAVLSTTSTNTSPSSAPQSGSFKSPTPAQAFPQVTRDLCEILSSRGRGSAWDPSRSQSAVFHTVLVDNNVRLPPKKTRPTPRILNATAVEQQSNLANLQPRSPLSPLHPSSPLFPDGLIAPIWLRKHRELVPSVFVSFYCLAEQSAREEKSDSKQETPKSNGAAAAAASQLTGAELKRIDEDLIKVISDRKRALGERGIKFTVVLLTTRAMLESPSLESRLPYIRRSSQLDSKASLFVLTPVSRGDLSEFVTSLQSALYDSAHDYYREHYRRAKKKRSKYPPPAWTVAQIMSAAAEIRGSLIKDSPLSKEGWLARNDYKLGTFAELTSNLNDALNHYISAYQSLVNQLLASTMLLPPRTKRWAEAKVLSDCLNFKICKIYLYKNDGESAWDQFKTHVKRFTELSQGWGIGEMTFEFWSWLGKQYRLMGDLLDLATRDTPGSSFSAFQIPIHFPEMPTFLLHPSHLPTPTVNGYIPPSHNPQHGNLAPPNDVALNTQVIPADMCLNAGGCFYLAGICAMERWQRFRKMMWEQENSTDKGEDGTWTTLTQERKVDHAGQAIEVFTRAHEVFKRFRLERQSLLVASRIAFAYVEGEQHEMALRFLERIVKTFRAEGWSAQTVSLLLLSLECSRRTLNVESEGRALWSLLSIDCPISTLQREEARKVLQSWQEKELQEGKKSITVESNGSDGIVAAEVDYAQNQLNLDDQGFLFQLRLTSPPGYPLTDLRFDQLVLFFSGSSTGFVIKHESNEIESIASLNQVDSISLDTSDDRKEIGKADLRWSSSQGSIRAFQGIVIPNKVGILQLEKICLEGKGATEFCLEIHMARLEEPHACFVQPRWLVKADPLTFIHLDYREDREGVFINKRSHKIDVEVVHDREAYLEETLAIQLTVHNKEAVDLDCLVEASVHAISQETAQDRIWLDDDLTKERSARAEETKLDILKAGSSLIHTVYLQLQQSIRTRTVEIIVKTVIPGDYTEGRSSEHLETITLPVKQLFSAAFHANWSVVRDSSLAIPPILARKPSITISDADEIGSEGGSEVTISTYADGDSPGMSSIATINVGLSVLPKEGILMKSVSLLLEETSKHLRFSNLADSLQVKNDVDEVWSNGDRWGTVYDVEVLSETFTGFTVEGEDGSLRHTGKLSIDWKREKSASDQIHTSLLDVPLLLPPTLLSRTVISIPISTTMEQPLVMLLTIVNPSKLSTEIFVAIDDSQSDFALLSHKTFSVPLIAKSTRSVPIHVLCKSSNTVASSHVIRLLPKIRAWQRDRRMMKKEPEGGGRVEEVNKAAAAAATTTTNTTAIIPIMDQQRGGGLPLDVQLHYSRPSSSPSSQQLQPPNISINNNHHKNSIAQLQAETNKTGAWTIFAHSQVDGAR